MSDTYLIPQFIIDYLKKSKSTKNPQKVASKSLRKNKTPEIEQWFKENEVTAGYLWKYFVFYGLNKFSFRECPVCGKRVKLSTIVTKPDVKYCSLECSRISKETQEKIKQTNFKKYGVEHPMQSKTVQEKKKQTCLEKYGVDSFSKTEEFKNEFKKTCLEKYGVEHSFQSEICKEKTKQTCLEKYGVEFISQSKRVKEKVKQTCLEKYGVEYISQTKDFREKYFKTQRTNYWNTFCTKLKERNVVPLFSEEEYINDTGRKFKCLICGKEFVSEGTSNFYKEHTKMDGTYSTLHVENIYCTHCFTAPYSQKEKEVVEFIKSIYSGEVLENHKGLFSNKQMELDIFLPALNLGIEFDGEYWHAFEKVKKRDERKNQLCEEKGIKLLRIKEEDWDTDKEKVKEEIKKYIL